MQLFIFGVDVDVGVGVGVGVGELFPFPIKCCWKYCKYLVRKKVYYIRGNHVIKKFSKKYDTFIGNVRCKKKSE